MNCNIYIDIFHDFFSSLYWRYFSVFELFRIFFIKIINLNLFYFFFVYWFHAKMISSDGFVLIDSDYCPRNFLNITIHFISCNYYLFLILIVVLFLCPFYVFLFYFFFTLNKFYLINVYFLVFPSI